MGDGNPGVSGRGDSRRDARHDLEWNGRVVAGLRFFAAAAEDERIAALEPDHALSLARELDDQRVDVLLRNRFLRFSGSDAALTNIVQLWVTGFSRIRRQNRGIGQSVIDDGIS